MHPGSTGREGQAAACVYRKVHPLLSQLHAFSIISYGCMSGCQPPPWPVPPWAFSSPHTWLPSSRHWTLHTQGPPDHKLFNRTHVPRSPLHTVGGSSWVIRDRWLSSTFYIRVINSGSTRTIGGNCSGLHKTCVRSPSNEDTHSSWKPQTQHCGS